MGGSGGGEGTTSTGETTIRYAPYVESNHQDFLRDVNYRTDRAIGQNPYDDYDALTGRVDTGFFGSGYSIGSYPSLYDMYGKFVAGLNIEALWAELFSNTLNGPQVGQLVQAEHAFLNDELDTTSLPRFQTGMRDLNAVNSSTFIIGQALLEDTKNKAVGKFSASLKYQLIPVAQDRHKSHLAWNSGVIGQYMDIMKYYFTMKQAYEEMDMTMQDRRMRWPLEMLDYRRASLGALQGAYKSTTSTEGGGGGGASTGAKVLGGALSGAAAGAYVGGPWGAVVGGVIGGLGGLLF
jgi:hypothetical protein